MNNLRFDELGLSPELLKAIEDMGFSEATPIQSQSIPHLMQGKDVIGQAQTGTGKTAAFGIPAIESLDPNRKEVQVLIMCPTRELAMQVSDEMSRLLKYKKGIRSEAIYGGQSIDRQIQALRRGTHIVVGTPGRIMDHLDRGTLHLEGVGMVVLDEADEMLDMGFRDDIEAILSEVPDQRQTVFFSATMPKPIMDLTRKYQKNPELVKVASKELTVSAIDQQYFDVKEGDKAIVLERLVDLYEPKLCLVFCNTKRKVDELVGTLQQQEFFAEALHGDMRQMQRTKVMNKFRQGIIQVLVATDVAARGIDVEDMAMVVNYDLPMDAEQYVHRIGRTGRAGRAGHAFSLVTKKDKPKLRDIERYAKTIVKQQPVPGLKEIEHKKKEKFLTRIKATISEGELDKYMIWIDELNLDGVSSRETAAALMKLELHKQIGQEDKLGGKESPRPRGKSKSGMARLFINLGRKDKVGPKDIVGAIAGEAGINGSDIGEIDLYDKFSFVEVPEDYAEQVMKSMRKSQIRGNKFKIERAEAAKA